MLKTKDDQKSGKKSTVKKKSKKTTVTTTKSKVTAKRQQAIRTTNKMVPKSLRKNGKLTNTDGVPSSGGSMKMTTSAVVVPTATLSNDEENDMKKQSTSTASKRKILNNVPDKKMTKNATPTIRSDNQAIMTTSSHGVKRRQRAKMSRTHSPVYVRVPAVRFDVRAVHSNLNQLSITQRVILTKHNSNINTDTFSQHG